jgi:hypothetical protein
MRQFIFGSNSATTTTGLTVAGATTLNFLNPPAGPNLDIGFIRHWAGQTSSLVSAQQRIQLATQVTAFPTLTSVTPRKVQLADPNVSIITGNTTGAAGTCGVNASAEGAGAKTLWWDDTFNVLNGYLKVNTPDEVECIPAGFASGVNLWFPTAPTSLTGWNWGQSYAELA